jgi:hypothetical protein
MPGLGEKRGTQRQPILKAGTISFDGSEIDCLVRNMSGEDANLEVESQIGIPNSFDLVIDSENHQCHVVWRKARRIGVAFFDGNEKPAVVSRWALGCHLKTLWPLSLGTLGPAL